MVNCCVPECPNKQKKYSARRFHCFPRDVNMIKVWLVAMKHKLATQSVSKDDVKNLRVCGDHFSPQDYKTLGRCDLKSGSVPSTFSWTSPHTPTPQEENELEVTLSSDDVLSDPDSEDAEEEEGMIDEEKQDSSDEWEVPTEASLTDSENSELSLDEEEPAQSNISNEVNSLPVVGCKECGTESTLRCSITRHEKVFACPRCGIGDGVFTRCFDKLLVRFSDFASFQSHAAKEHGTISNRTLCPECGVFFTPPMGTNGKKEHVCAYKFKLIVCSYCEKRFVNEKGLKSHIRAIHGNAFHCCKFCLKPFWNRPAKLEHEQTHPKAEKEPYHCSECPLKFSNIVSRNHHLRTHRGPWNFVCKSCGKGFTTNEKLERHELLHSGERPFRCEVCDRSFTQENHLKSHMRVHTGEKPYKCKLCEKSFTHNVSLKSHVQRYHGAEAPPGGAQALSKPVESYTARSGRPKGRPRRALVDTEQINNENHTSSS